MKKYIFALSFSMVSLLVSAQNSDTLRIGKTNRQFYIKGDQTFKASDYKKVFTNVEALNYMQKSRTNSTFSQIFGGIGGGLMGFGMARALSGGDKEVYINGALVKEKQKGNWGLVGIGLGVVGIGIPFAISSGKNLKKAVKTQNQADSGESGKTTSYRLDIGGNGVGLSYNF